MVSVVVVVEAGSVVEEVLPAVLFAMEVMVVAVVVGATVAATWTFGPRIAPFVPAVRAFPGEVASRYPRPYHVSLTGDCAYSDGLS